MRRLDLHPKRKLKNPGRHLRSLRRWADGFAGFDWSAHRSQADQNFLHWRIPIHAKLVSEPHTTPQIQAEVLQCLVDAASHLHDALPPECRHMPVATLVQFPHLFNSEVTLFVNPDYFRGFKPETVVVAKSHITENYQVDSGPSRTDIVEKFAIKLPAGARTGGYYMREIDHEWPEGELEYERWTMAFWDGD